MVNARRVVKNTTAILLSEITVKIIAFFIAVYLARYLGVEDYGKYSFVTVYLTLFTIIGGLGLDVVIVRDISRNSSITDKIMGNIFVIRLITSIFAILLAIIGIHLIKKPEEITYYVIFTSSILLFQSLSYLNESLFKAKIRMEYFAYTVVIHRIIIAMLIIGIIFLKGNLIHIFSAIVFSEAIRTVIGFVYSRKFTKYNLYIDLECWKYLVKEALPFLLNGVFLIIHYRIDVIMLSIIKGDISVGLYSAGYKLTDPLLFIPGAISASLLPVISKQYFDKKDSMKNTFLQGTRYIFIMMCPIIIGIYILSNIFIEVIFGLEFLDSAFVLQILVGSLLLNSLNSMQNSALISTNREKIVTLSLGTACTLNILLNIILIPKYDYIGAAFATLISVATLYTIQLYFVSKTLAFPINKNFIKPLISSIVMGIGILVMMEYNLIYVVIISAIVYIASMLLLKGYTKEDIDLVQKIINKRS